MLVIDEVQKVPGWAETCKLLFDEHRSKRDLKIVLLGSASLSIQEGLAAALLGRFELIHVPHWNFQECRKAYGWDFQTYVQFGGYPAPAEFLPDVERWRSFMHDAVIEPVLGRDISGLVRINKPALFRQTFKLVMQYPAQVLSYQKLLGQLQDRGNAATIKHYLELFEAAFLLKRLEKFSGSTLVSTHSSPKIIPRAPALITAMTDTLEQLHDPTLQGRLFEAVVGAQLLHLPGELFYWSEGNYKVDFVRRVDDQVIAYEVKSGLTHKAKSLEIFRRKYRTAKIEIIDKRTAQQWFE